MHEVWAEAPGLARIPSIDLRLAWNVVLERSATRYGYQVTKQQYPVGLVAVRTMFGEGEFELAETGRIRVGTGDLLLFDRKDLFSYTCITDKWEYWWFKFIVYGPHRLALSRVHPTEWREGEIEACQRVFGLVKSHSFDARAYASSIFASLLYGWLANPVVENRRNKREGLVWALVRQMQEILDGSWTVADMAESSGISERRLNQLFHEAVSMGPKKYYTLLRMKHAKELLSSGDHRVSQVAQILGFKDIYHFSRSFKSCMGYPPSHVFGAALRNEVSSSLSTSEPTR